MAETAICQSITIFSFFIRKVTNFFPEYRDHQIRDYISKLLLEHTVAMWQSSNPSNLSGSSVQFNYSVMSNSLRPHGLQYARLPVHHQLPKLAQTHAHWVGDAIQLSYSLSSPSPPAFSLSQHQGLFQRVSSSHQVAKILEFQLQHQSFQWIFRTDFL